jgi:hypothetical protein
MKIGSQTSLDNYQLFLQKKQVSLLLVSLRRSAEV